jgi:outer membrane protein
MKHNLLKTTTLFITLFLSQAVFSQRAITLKEAIDLSVKNSGQLKNSEAKINEATAALKEAIERRLPNASFSASHLRVNSPNVDLKVKSSGSSGSGTQLEPEKISSASYGILNVSLPIYAGFRIKYGIEAAQHLHEATKLDAENDREAVILNTINAFDNLYKAKAAVALVKESLQGARERVKQFANLEKNGLLARNDYLKAELQASNIELSLLDAENNLKLATISMDLMLGLPDNTELNPDLTSQQAATQLKGIEEYVQLGLQHRKDVAALALRKRAAATGVKAAKGDLYPSIALTGGYVAAYVPNLITITNAANIGLGLQYSISSLWKNNAKVDQAKAREKQLQTSEGMLQDAVRLEVNQAYQNYLSTQKKIEVYQKAITQATENYKIVSNKYNNALATTTDLLDADVAQLQARLNYAFATADATVAYSKLLQTAGLITENNN